MQRQLAELLHLSDDQTLPISGSVQRMARGALYFRERRRTILGTDNFADPGWDLLPKLDSDIGTSVEHCLVSD